MYRIPKSALFWEPKELTRDSNHTSKMAPKRSVQNRGEVGICFRNDGKELLSTQEGVLRKVYDLYNHPTTAQNCGDKGIVDMARDVGISKLCPRNKATVMILGNHSSGKSSFINCSCCYRTVI